MKLNRITITYIAALAILAPMGVWFAHVAACLYNYDFPLCGHQYSAYIILSGTVAAVIGWVALAIRLRLRRRLLGGMYAKPVGVAGQRVLASIATVGRWAWEGEARPSHPHEYPASWGWRVALSDGTEVIVTCDDFRAWLYACYDIQQAEPNRGPTSRRTWRARGLDDAQIAARNWLLDQSGLVRRNKAAANSIRRLTATPWPIFEAVAEAVGPGEV